MGRRTDRIEQEYCPVFHKQVSIRISTLKLLGQDKKNAPTHISYKCQDAVVAAECLCCKLVNR